jgi:hypothetical protein
MSSPPAGADLDPALVVPALDKMTADRHHLDGQWLDAKAAIRAGESGFGPPDRLNQAFRSGYRPMADEVTPEADRRQGQYGELIAAGHDSVEIYRLGDGDGAIAFPTAY